MLEAAAGFFFQTALSSAHRIPGPERGYAADHRQHHHSPGRHGHHQVRVFLYSWTQKRHMRSFLQLRVRRIGALCKLRLSLTETDKLFMRSSQWRAVLLRFKALVQKFGVQTCLVAGARLLARRDRAGICASEEGASASLTQSESVPGQ